MRRAEKQCTDKALLTEFLNTSQVMQMAISTDGAPYVLPLNYVYVENSLIFHGATVGRKIDLLKANPNVGFTINEMIKVKLFDTPVKTGTSYRSVIGTAKASFIESTKEKTEYLNILLEKFTPHRNSTFNDDMLVRVAVVKLDIIEIDFKVDIPK